MAEENGIEALEDGNLGVSVASTDASVNEKVKLSAEDGGANYNTLNNSIRDILPTTTNATTHKRTTQTDGEEDYQVNSTDTALIIDQPISAEVRVALFGIDIHFC